MAHRTTDFLYEHRGMRQADRRYLAPSADAMLVSGRRFEDLVKRTAEFAGSVAFYGDDNKVCGDWSVFFSRVYDKENHRVRTEIIDEMVRTSSVPPHLALLFAFYQMLLVEQKDLNNLTDRQMEFYFRDILGFSTREGVEGPVTVFADLAKNNPSVSIPKGTLFDAGKDAAGETVTYESEDELRLGREEVALLVTYDDASGFEAVGGDVPGRMHALCVTSQLFGLTGGALHVSIGEGGYVHGLLAGLQVEYTSAEGWTHAGVYDFDNGLTVSGEMPPMVPYDISVHGEGMDTPWPVIRLVSRDGIGDLARISPEAVRKIRVLLNDGTSLRIENKYGAVENRSGVNPFGYECRRGDWFRVVLPFPASGLSLSVEMNIPKTGDRKVYEEVVNETGSVGTGLDGVAFRIVSDECDQEHVSKEFSMKLLTVMKRENLAEEEIKKALDGSVMAVSPRLTSPVMIQEAVFSDDAAEVFLAHPCGIRSVRGQELMNDCFRLADPAVHRGEDDAAPSAVYIAFAHADLDRGQLSLHVRLKSSEKMKEPGRLAWYYLSGDQWEKFGESRVLRDTTCGLSQDGTVVLDYQEKLQAGGAGFLRDYAWIKGECSNGNCLEIIAVRSRAIELTYHRFSKGSGPSGEALPAGTISRTTVSIPGLKKISQPEDGQPGMKTEDPVLFRRRVAEQLRHKGRAWTAWDYESLVLGAFPEVAYAKCLPSGDGKGEVAPGIVTMLVIPEIFEDELEPSAVVRLVNKVRAALQKVCSPFVDIRIEKPVYKRVKVVASIALRKGYNDPVRYEALVNDALRDYLRSWKGYGQGLCFKEGNGVSEIIAFLESLPYVDVIESIRVHLDGNNEPVGMEGSIHLNTPLEVITSAADHEVYCHTAN